MKQNVLVSSSGKKAPLLRAMQDAAREVLPHYAVIAGDINKGVPTQYIADSFWVMPPTHDDFLEEIIYGLKRENVRIVLPTRDGELMFWANNAERLTREGIQVIVSSTDSLQRCLDKLEFSRFGISLGLPFIPTSELCDDLESNCLVVKERYGSGSRSIGLRLSLAEAIAYSQKIINPIFQPFIDGQEISIDSWLDRQHQVKGLILRRRDYVLSGESQVTTTFTDSRLESQAAEILHSLRLSGPVVLQALINANGELHVIECNPRFGGASTLGIEAGLLSLHWSLLEASGADLAKWPFRRIKGQVRLIRLPNDLYVNDFDF